MAKNRYVNTHFWDDSFIMDLDPIEKLLFLYFLTNPLTNIAGAYELHLKQVALHTGIDRDMIVKILIRFEESNKIIYKDGWILILNFIKHQAKNPKIQKGIETTVNDCPQWIKDRLYIAYESLSKPLNNLNLNLNTNSNLNLNMNSNVSASPETENTPAPMQKHFANTEDFPESKYYEAFPDLIGKLTIHQTELLKETVLDTELHKEAYKQTIAIYRGNIDRKNNRYLPEKLGTFLQVFTSELEKMNGNQSSKPKTSAQMKAELREMEARQ